MALIIEKPWRTQPQIAVPLNPWIAKDTTVINAALNYAFNGGFKNISLIKRAIPGGVGFTSSLSTARIETGPFKLLSSQGATVVLQLFYRRSRTSSSSFNFEVSSIDNKYIESFEIDGTTTGFSAGNVQFRLFNGVAVTEKFYGTTSAPLKNGNLYTIIIRFNETTAQIYINGILQSLTTTGSFTIPISDDLTTCWVMQGGNTSDRHYNLFYARQYGWIENPEQSADPNWVWNYFFQPQHIQLNSPPAPRIYYVAGPNATWATPTSTEIINGQLAGGGAATASWSESAPLTTTTPFNFSQPASPLTTGTKYRAAAVQKAGDSNVVSNVVVSDPFLAGAATLSNPEATDITSTTTKPKVTVSY